MRNDATRADAKNSEPFRREGNRDQGYSASSATGSRSHSSRDDREYIEPIGDGQNGIEDDSRGGRTGKKRPVHEVRVGRIVAAIWENHFEDGRGVNFSVTLSKHYKQGEQWKVTQSLGRDDLLVASKVLDLCHTWVAFQGSGGNLGK